MDDLKNLPPGELAKRTATLPLDQPEWTEIRRRLEDYEQLKLNYVASESLRRQMREQTAKDLIVFQQVRERLAKCEAALKKYYKGHNTRLAGGCHCDSCDADRAALEEK